MFNAKKRFANQMQDHSTIIIMQPSETPEDPNTTATVLVPFLASPKDTSSSSRTSRHDTATTDAPSVGNTTDDMANTSATAHPHFLPPPPTKSSGGTLYFPTRPFPHDASDAAVVVVPAEEGACVASNVVDARTGDPPVESSPVASSVGDCGSRAADISANILDAFLHDDTAATLRTSAQTEHGNLMVIPPNPGGSNDKPSRTDDDEGRGERLGDTADGQPRMHQPASHERDSVARRRPVAPLSSDAIAEPRDDKDGQSSSRNNRSTDRHRDPLRPECTGVGGGGGGGDGTSQASAAPRSTLTRGGKQAASPISAGDGKSPKKALAMNSADSPCSTTSSGRSRRRRHKTAASTSTAQLESVLQAHLVGQVNLHKRNIYISGLPPHFTSADFRNLCQEFGRVEALKIRIDASHTPTKGYGFALFYSEESAAASIRGLHGTCIGSRRLQARYADSEATPQAIAADPAAAAAAAAHLHPPLQRDGGTAKRVLANTPNVRVGGKNVNPKAHDKDSGDGNNSTDNAGNRVNGSPGRSHLPPTRGGDFTVSPRCLPPPLPGPTAEPGPTDLASFSGSASPAPLSCGAPPHVSTFISPNASATAVAAFQPVYYTPQQQTPPLRPQQPYAAQSAASLYLPRCAPPMNPVGGSGFQMVPPPPPPQGYMMVPMQQQHQQALQMQPPLQQQQLQLQQQSCPMGYVYVPVSYLMTSPSLHAR